MTDPALREAIKAKADFLYADNAYFHRSPRGPNFRLIRGGIHLTTLLDCTDERLHKWAPEVRDWRTNGSDVIVIPPSDAVLGLFRCTRWLARTVNQLKRYTDRPIYIKRNKYEPLVDRLTNAWAVVTYASVAGLEAALFGVPVFAGPVCCALPISAGSVKDIEMPRYPDREPWLKSLACATWSIDELDRINWKDYRYQWNLANEG